jgi:hypothetical protein
MDGNWRTSLHYNKEIIVKKLLLILVCSSCYGNVPIKQSLFKKILCVICPCVKKPKRIIVMHRVESSDDLNIYGSTPVREIHRRDYFRHLENLKKQELLTVPAN